MSEQRNLRRGAARIAANDYAAMALLLLLATGCAGGPWSSRAAPDVRPLKAQRAKEAGKLFGDQRDRSEFEAAKFAWQQNDAPGCRELLEKLLKRNPKHREAGLLLAELLLVEQRPEPAREQLERVLAQYPEDAETLHALGLLFDAEDQPAEAQAHFERAVKAAPDNREYRLSCEAAAERLHRSSETETIASDDSVQLATDEAPLPADSAEDDAAQASSRRKVEPSSSHAEHAESPPDAPKAKPEPWLIRADAALGSGQRENARRQIQQARRAAPRDANIPLAAAVLAIKHDELEFAVEIAQTGIRNFPESAGLYRTLGAAQYRLGEFESAIDSFERAISLDKSHPLSYFLVGSTLKRLGQTAAAEANFRQAERLDPRYAARR